MFDAWEIETERPVQLWELATQDKLEKDLGGPHFEPKFERALEVYEPLDDPFFQWAWMW